MTDSLLRAKYNITFSFNWLVLCRNGINMLETVTIWNMLLDTVKRL
jgi:hypothetical protein